MYEYISSAVMGVIMIRIYRVWESGHGLYMALLVCMITALITEKERDCSV